MLADGHSYIYEKKTLHPDDILLRFIWGLHLVHGCYSESVRDIYISVSVSTDTARFSLRILNSCQSEMYNISKYFIEYY